MSDRYFPLYVHAGEERSLIVDAERKDTMLIWKLEGAAEDSAVRCLRYRHKFKTMIGREHGKFKLQSVRGINLERTEMIVRILRDLDVEGLRQELALLVAR